MKPFPIRLELAPEHVPAAASAAWAALAHSTESPFTLTWDGQAVALQGPSGSLVIDWLQGRTQYRATRARQEKLVRACGVMQDSSPHVVDATPGLGMDAWLLAASGARVTLIEQNPVTILLLADAIRRAVQTLPEQASRLGLLWGDSRRLMGALPRPEVLLSAVYLDPMYPARTKSALGAASLRLLAELNTAAGFTHDEVATLFAAAREASTRRVVLKRPLRVPLPARLPPPGHSLSGRSTRFDVWRIQP